MPAIFILMTAISRHYHRVAEELAPEPGGMLLPAREPGIGYRFTPDTTTTSH